MESTIAPQAVNGHHTNVDVDVEEDLDANDFLGSRYLQKKDIIQPQVVTIVGVRAETMPSSGKRELVAQFAEFEKGLYLNSGNKRMLINIFGTGKTREWRGKVTIYVNPSVEYHGQRVGGIRLRPAPKPSPQFGDGHDWEPFA